MRKDSNRIFLIYIYIWSTDMVDKNKIKSWNLNKIKKLLKMQWKKTITLSAFYRFSSSK
jgi:hypothetical protein